MIFQSYKGTGDSGKSTIIKQLRIIYGSDYSHDERMAYRSKLLENIVDCAKTLVQAMHTLKIPFAFDPAHVEKSDSETVDAHKENVKKEAERLFDANLQSPGSKNVVMDEAAALVLSTTAVYSVNDNLSADVINAIKTLWSDAGVQYCAKRGNEYNLLDSCA
jgi:guanine nucleotide-binding protein G(q) subunit alpha